MTFTVSTGTSVTSTDLFATNGSFTNLSVTNPFTLGSIIWTNATGTSTTSTNLDVTSYVRLPTDTQISSKAVCLSDGTNCPSGTTPNLQTVTNTGNTTTHDIQFNGGTSTGAFTIQNNLTVTGTTALQGLTFTSGTGTYLDFTTTTANPASAEGRLFYDNIQKALAYFSGTNTDPIHLGQEIQLLAKNLTGSTILHGQAVRVIGSDSGLPTIALARADSNTTVHVAGLADEDIANGASGHVLTEGDMHGLDTSAFSAGDVLYLSAATSGALTNARPATPNITLEVGVVIKSDPAVGSLLVHFIEPKFGAITTGGVTYGDANNFITDDSQNFFFDAATKRLGIGTGAPSSTLHVVGSTQLQALTFTDATGTNATTALFSSTIGHFTSGSFADVTSTSWFGFATASGTTSNATNAALVNLTSENVTLSGGTMNGISIGALNPKTAAFTDTTSTGATSTSIFASSAIFTNLSVTNPFTLANLIWTNATGTNTTSTNLAVTSYARLPSNTQINSTTVCLSDGTNCPSGTTPTLQTVTNTGNTTTRDIQFNGGTSTGVFTIQNNLTVTGTTALQGLTFTNGTSSNWFGFATASGSSVFTNDLLVGTTTRDVSLNYIQQIEANANNSSGLKIANYSTGTAATAVAHFFDDQGLAGTVFANGSNFATFPNASSSFGIAAKGTRNLRLSTNGGDMRFTTLPSNPNPDIIILGTGANRGNVGIGTLTPSAKFEVNGGMIASDITITNATTTNATTSELFVGSLARLPLNTQINNATVCLSDGTNCPSGTTPNFQTVTNTGNTTTHDIQFNGGTSTGAFTIQNNFTVTGTTALQGLSFTNGTSTSWLGFATATGTTLNAITVNATGLVSGSVTITGGTVNGTTIGATTPSTAVFTTATATNLFATNGSVANATSTSWLGFATASGTTINATNAALVNLTSENVTLTGGTINGVSIGATNASTAIFTSVTSTYATSTYFFSTNGIITNGTVTGLNWTNATGTSVTSTNLFVTNGSVANMSFTNGTSTSWFGYATASGTTMNTLKLNVNGQATFNDGFQVLSAGTSTFAGNLGVTGNIATTGTLVFMNTTATIQMVDNGSLSVTDGTNNLLQMKDLNTNFGAAISAGAFMDRNSTIQEEFNKFRTAITADTAGTAGAGMGDGGGWGAYESSNCNISSVANGTNGLMRITSVVANNGCLVMMDDGLRTANTMLTATNLPVMLMKVRPSSNANTNDISYVGMADATDGAVAAPTNFIGFSGTSTWIGQTISGGVATTIQCSGQTISTTNFALLMVEVRSTTDVHFFVDSDVSNGINFTECGTGSKTNIPTIGLAPELAYQAQTGGVANSFLDVDFYRAWQDDPKGKTVASAAQLQSTVTPDFVTQSGLAQFFPTDDSELLAGTLVSLDANATGTRVKATDAAHDPNMVGIVTEDPGLVLSNGSIEGVRVVTHGRAQAFASLENGPIKTGDALTSASATGTVMRATSSGPVIGRALGAMSASGTVLLLVEPGYHFSSAGTSDMQQLLGSSATDTVATALQPAAATPEISLPIGSEIMQGLGVGTLVVRDAEFTNNVTVIGTTTLRGPIVFGTSNSGVVNVDPGQYVIDVLFQKPYPTTPRVFVSPVIEDRSGGLGYDHTIWDGGYYLTNVTSTGFEIRLPRGGYCPTVSVTPCPIALSFNWFVAGFEEATSSASVPSQPSIAPKTDGGASSTEPVAPPTSAATDVTSTPEVVTPIAPPPDSATSTASSTP